MSKKEKNMSKHKHNYQKHYNAENAEQPKIQSVPTNDVEETEIEETVQAPVVNEAEPVTEVIGMVTKCVKLNIRKEPSIDAEVLCEVVATSPLSIDLENSTDEWLSVGTELGVEGFCMKKYVNIKQ